MNNVMDDLAELHNKKHKYNLELWELNSKDEYTIYNDLIFEDDQTLEEYLEDDENFGGNCNSRGAFEKAMDELYYSKEVEYKTGMQLIKEALEK